MSSDSHYPASLYVALHDGVVGDAQWYRSACDPGSRVLELGCGAGRVLAALDHATRYGIDLHDGLLDLARARLGPSAVIARGDMRSFRFDHVFDRVLLPFSGVYCLLSDDDVAACFTRVRQHLAPGGHFLLDGYRAEDFHANAEPEDLSGSDWTEVGAISVDGATYVVFEQSSWSPDEQRVDVTYRHVPLDGRGSTVDGTIPQRYLLADQLRRHLREAGFTSIELWGGFAQEPLGPSSEHWVARATAPG